MSRLNRDRKPYLIHAEFLIEAESDDDAQEAVRSALLDNDLAPRWRCERTWWSGEMGAPLDLRYERGHLLGGDRG